MAAPAVTPGRPERIRLEPVRSTGKTLVETNAETVSSAPARPGHGLGHARPLWTLAVLSMLMGFDSISTDLYLPALPGMARALGAGVGQVEWTVSGYLVGFSLGQLVWGPVGDRFGRRAPVAAGLLLFSLGSAGCATAAGVGALIGWRIVQSLGACAGVVLARAMVRDLYPRDRAAQMLSVLITVMAVAPLAGPLVGGQVLAWASWRAIFWLLVGVGLATLAALATLPETLPAASRTRAPLRAMAAGYGPVLRDPAVRAYAGAGGLFYAGIFAYIAGTPFAYVAYYGVPAQLYGLLFGASIVGIMLANLANARLASRVGSDRLLRQGAAGAALAGAASAVSATTGWGGLFGLAAPLLVYCAMSGLIVANSIAGALARHPGRAGSASALVGAIQYGAGIVGSGLVGLLADGTPRALGLVVAASGLGCYLIARRLGDDPPPGSKPARSLPHPAGRGAPDCGIPLPRPHGGASARPRARRALC